MTTNLGFSKRATFNERLVKINHKLEVENLEAKHSSITFNEEDDHIEIINNDEEVTHIIDEQGTTTIVGDGVIHASQIDMRNTSPWSQLADYQNTTFTENNTIATVSSPSDSDFENLYSLFDFTSVRHEQYYFEFKITSKTGAVDIDVGICVSAKRNYAVPHDYTQGLVILKNLVSADFTTNDEFILVIQTDNTFVFKKNYLNTNSGDLTNFFNGIDPAYLEINPNFTFFITPKPTSASASVSIKLVDTWKTSTNRLTSIITTDKHFVMKDSDENAFLQQEDGKLTISNDVTILGNFDIKDSDENPILTSGDGTMTILNDVVITGKLTTTSEQKIHTSRLDMRNEHASSWAQMADYQKITFSENNTVATAPHSTNESVYSLLDFPVNNRSEQVNFEFKITNKVGSSSIQVGLCQVSNRSQRTTQNSDSAMNLVNPNATFTLIAAHIATDDVFRLEINTDNTWTLYKNTNSFITGDYSNNPDYSNLGTGDITVFLYLQGGSTSNISIELIDSWLGGVDSTTSEIITDQLFVIKDSDENPILTSADGTMTILNDVVITGKLTTTGDSEQKIHTSHLDMRNEHASSWSQVANYQDITFSENNKVATAPPDTSESLYSLLDFPVNNRTETVNFKFKITNNFAGLYITIGLCQISSRSNTTADNAESSHKNLHTLNSTNFTANDVFRLEINTDDTWTLYKNTNIFIPSSPTSPNYFYNILGGDDITIFLRILNNNSTDTTSIELIDTWLGSGDNTTSEIITDQLFVIKDSDENPILTSGDGTMTISNDVVITGRLTTTGDSEQKINTSHLDMRAEHTSSWAQVANYQNVTFSENNSVANASTLTHIYNNNESVFSLLDFPALNRTEAVNFEFKIRDCVGDVFLQVGLCQTSNRINAYTTNSNTKINLVRPNQSYFLTDNDITANDIFSLKIDTDDTWTLYKNTNSFITGDYSTNSDYSNLGNGDLTVFIELNPDYTDNTASISIEIIDTWLGNGDNTTSVIITDQHLVMKGRDEKSYLRQGNDKLVLSNTVLIDQGDLNVLEGKIIGSEVVLHQSSTPWSTLDTQQFYVFSDFDSLASTPTSGDFDDHVLFSAQTFPSVGRTDSIFTEFKIQSLGGSNNLKLQLGVGVIEIMSDSRYDNWHNTNTNDLVFQSGNPALLTTVNDVIKIELTTANVVKIYKNDVLFHDLDLSSSFTDINNNHQGSATQYCWYVRPRNTNGQGFQLKMIDTGESTITFNELLNINKGSTNILNMDEKSCDFEVPFHCKSVSTVLDMTSLSSSVDSSAIVWCDELNSACMYDNTSQYWYLLSGRYQKKRITTRGFSSTLQLSKQVVSDLRIQFTALTPNYQIHVFLYFEDTTSSISGIWTCLRNMTNNADNVWSPDFTAGRYDENDDLFLKISYLMTNLQIGNTYDIAPAFRKSYANDNIYIRNGLHNSIQYPYGYIEVESIGVNCTITN